MWIGFRKSCIWLTAENSGVRTQGFYELHCQDKEYHYTPERKTLKQPSSLTLLRHTKVLNNNLLFCWNTSRCWGVITNTVKCTWTVSLIFKLLECIWLLLLLQPVPIMCCSYFGTQADGIAAIRSMLPWQGPNRAQRISNKCSAGKQHTLLVLSTYWPEWLHSLNQPLGARKYCHSVCLEGRTGNTQWEVFITVIFLPE